MEISTEILIFVVIFLLILIAGIFIILKGGSIMLGWLGI